MLGDPWLTHSQSSDELPDRLLAFSEEVEDLPAVGLGEDLERLTHRGTLLNRYITVKALNGVEDIHCQKVRIDLDWFKGSCFLSPNRLGGVAMRFSRTFRLGLVLVASLALLIPAPLQAARDDSGSVAETEVIAEGLSEPRGLAFGPGKKELCVAEAGEGGDGPCAEHPILGDACYGKTGVITRIDEKGVKSVVKNLGSIAGPVEGLGPHDVSIHGRQLAFTTGFAGPPELRAQFGREAERTLGYLMTSPLKGGHQSGNVSRVADLVAYEDDANPAGGPVDSNPFRCSRARKVDLRCGCRRERPPGRQPDRACQDDSRVP